MAVKLGPFEDAMASANRRGGKKSVLLGNGFSRALSDNFSYDHLRDVASERSLSVNTSDLFDRAQSSDFETVIKTLEHAATIVELYNSTDANLHANLLSDAEAVKKLLVDCLTEIHPESSFSIADPAYASTRTFLSNFDRIFTLNYDLLLYWCSLADEFGPDIVRNDGFRGRDDRLKWIKPTSFMDQELFYLHGAVHLYEDAGDVYKLKYGGGKRNRILDQVRENLKSGRYPLVVTEGTQENKESRIAENSYLKYCHMRLTKLTGHLFIHGAALSDNDKHILERIARSENLGFIYVGLFGDPSEEHDRIRATMDGLVRNHASYASENHRSDSLQVSYYQSESVNLWQLENPESTPRKFPL